MAVQVIRAQTPDRTTAGETPVRQRVAAYCRVSTDSAEQESSYEAQRAHYAALLAGRPDWEAVGVYADEGVSGTQAKKRPDFLRLIGDCRAGRIDLVVTKSISRFARNTLDCLNYIRELKALGVAVFFEKENINTLDPKGEVLITIMASIAQQESQSISQNVTMGLRYRMQEGKGPLNTAFFLGFTRDKGSGRLRIVPEEAKTVRRIFRDFLEGCSKQRICERLTAEGVPPPEGGQRWYPSTVGSMLENEKYAGDLLLQKSYVEDYLTHKKVKNRGRLPQYYVENAHEPIVPRAVFRQARDELARRSALKSEPGRIRLGSRELLPGRLVCGRCGRVLKRYLSPDGEADWRCRKRAYEKKSATRELPGRCGCRRVSEAEARQAILAAFARLPEQREALLCLRARLAAEAAEGRSAEERAEAALRGMRALFLLELIDAMNGAPEAEGAPLPAACTEAEDFFRRTRFRPRAELLDEEGRLVRFDDETLTRCLCAVTVNDEGYLVKLRAGIEIEV